MISIPRDAFSNVFTLIKSYIHPAIAEYIELHDFNFYDNRFYIQYRFKASIVLCPPMRITDKYDPSKTYTFDRKDGSSYIIPPYRYESFIQMSHDFVNYYDSHISYWSFEMVDDHIQIETTHTEFEQAFEKFANECINDLASYTIEIED